MVGGIVSLIYTTNAIINLDTVCKIIKDVRYMSRLPGGVVVKEYVLIVSFIDNSTYTLFFTSQQDLDKSYDMIFNQQYPIIIKDKPLKDTNNE